MDIDAELSLVTLDGEFLGEDQMEAPDGVDMGRYNEFSGAVTIYVDEEAFSIGDMMTYVVSQTCAAIPIQLKSEGQATYTGFSHDEDINFELDGDKLKITGAYRQDLTVPAKPVLQALVKAGQRFARMLPTMWPDAPQDAVQQLSGQMQDAAVAIGLE